MIAFLNTSTAGNAAFTTSGGLVSDEYGTFTEFFDSSTAGNATCTNNGGTVTGALGGFTEFRNTSTAGNGTFINNGATVSGAFGGGTTFSNRSSIGNAVLIANGGLGENGGGAIFIGVKSHGGTARVEVFDNGYLDISGHVAGSVSIGSLEGNGFVFLGANNLTVGTNNLSTVFPGVVQDDGQIGGTGSSLTKIGTGTLTLSNANTYTGGTTVQNGSLLVKNTTGSATGAGPVQVNHGILGQAGIISGAVTVGNGTRTGAILLPGTVKKPGTLTINNTLTFNSLSTYKCVLDRAASAAGKIKAVGVTINTNVAFSFVDTTTGTLTPGTAFIVIKNNSANPVAGTFSNLADGQTFTSNGNTFRASYEGGDGNDLTLTVQ